MLKIRLFLCHNIFVQKGKHDEASNDKFTCHECGHDVGLRTAVKPNFPKFPEIWEIMR